jgi:membrane protease YdiL (CAAX protease family)
LPGHAALKNTPPSEADLSRQPASAAFSRFLFSHERFNLFSMLSVKPWRTDAVFFFVAAQMFCVLMGGVIVAALHKTGVPGFKDLDGLGGILLGTLSFQGATWILMALFFRFHSVHWKEALGFDKKKWPFSLLLALGTMIVMLPVAYLLQHESVVLMQKIGWKPQEEEAVTLVANASSRAEQVYLAIFAVILAPVAEEFIFRGMLFPFIKQLGYPKTAWLSVSLLFALIHMDASVFVPLFVLALAFTWLYETTDCLIAPIFAHMLFNVTGFILIKIVPQ